jgi:hypothetical protein
VSVQRYAPAALYPQEMTPGTHWTGGWVGLRAGLDTEARGKFRFCRGSNPGRRVLKVVVDILNKQSDSQHVIFQLYG